PLAMRCTYDPATRLLDLHVLDGRRVISPGMDDPEQWELDQARRMQFSACLTGPESDLAAEAAASACDWARTLPQGRVDLIGAGPGNVDLITLQGKHCLEQADAIVYDRLASPGFLGLAGPDAKLYPVGKKAGEQTMPQDQINDLLVALARQGKRVARLKGGDPFVFGRGGEEALHLKAHGIPFAIVPGVSSAVAVPAYAGIPVTHRGCSAAFQVISGHDSKSGDLKLDFSRLARSDGSLVCLMGLASLPQLCQGLLAAGLDPKTPAATIQSGTTGRQRLVTATIRDLPAAVAQANLQSPAISVIGPAVALAPELAWFTPGPLQGRRIALTRARNKKATSDWAARIQELGGEPVELDLIRIVSLAGTPQVASALQQLRDFSWLVLTSPAGVETFMEALRLANQDIRALAHCRIAAIGAATADGLLNFGLKADYVPETFTSEALTEGLLPLLKSTDHVLIFTAAAGSSQLADTLHDHLIPCQSVVAYQTAAIPAHAQALLQNLDRIDVITFASASSVHALADGIAASSMISLEQFLAHQIPLYCIGPMTARACEMRGLPVRAIAREASFEQLIQLILSDDIAHSTGDEG
ncbi:MAG: uroporphyrinogen-III C-methyltransferase, partial [Clostridia bacterium]|nr:uroporphyrinogen-III C-methyltransferase [Clostridia bacterium]